MNVINKIKNLLNNNCEVHDEPMGDSCMGCNKCKEEFLEFCKKSANPAKYEFNKTLKDILE